MPLPDNWTKVTITHQNLTAGGAPMRGTVTWTPSVPVTNPSAGVTVLAAQRAHLDDDGRWSVTVPVVDAAQATPVGWHYEVMFDLRDPSGRGVVSTYLVQVTSAMVPVPPAASVDWSALAEVSPVGEVTPYLRRVDVGTTAGTVAAGNDARLVGAVQLAGDLGGVAASPRTLWSPPRGRAWPASAPQMLAAAADSTMQAGHAWTVTNSTGSTAWTGEAASGGVGTQCVKVTTTGGGVGTQALMTLPRQAAFDMTGKAFRVLVKLDAATYSKLAFIKLYVGGGTNQFDWFWNVTIATGLDNPTASIKAGEWVWLTLTPQVGWSQTGTPVRSQIRDLRFIIADDGTGPTTVYIGGFQLVPMDTATYPNGVISVTFDDAYATQWDARQYMDRYRMPGTAYVIADRVGTDNAQWLSHTQLKAMQEQSGWEIACHTYASSAHAAAWGYQTIGAAASTTDLLAVRRWLQDNGYRAPHGLALAKGGWDLTLADELRRQLAYARLVTNNDRSFGETLPPADPHRLRAYLPAVDAILSPNTTRNTLQWFVDQVAASKCWLILGFHNLPVTTSVGSDFPWATFTGLVDYIAASGIPVRTVSDVLGIGR